MINDEEVKKILDTPELTVEGIIQVIQRYIYDKKQVEVHINPPIGRQTFTKDGIMVDYILMDIMFDFASAYYIDKFKE